MIANGYGGAGGMPMYTDDGGRPWRKPGPGDAQNGNHGSGFVGGLGSAVRGIGAGGQAMWNWLSGNQGTGALQDDRFFTYKNLDQGSPYINNASPYAGQQGQLIAMLQNRAAGNGPSVAGDAYKSAAADAMARAMSLSNSGNAGSTRLALQQMGNQEQGMAQGYAAARNQEMQGATGQLGTVINQADTSQLLRDKANQEAWLQMLRDVYQGDQAMAQSSKNNGETLGSLIKGFAGGGL